MLGLLQVKVCFIFQTYRVMFTGFLTRKCVSIINIEYEP